MWFNGGPRHRVEVEPTPLLNLTEAGLDTEGLIVPDSIPADYRFDPAGPRATLVADVTWGLQVYTSTGKHSTAVEDTLRGFTVALPLPPTALEADVEETDASPSGGQMLCYTYACSPGDSIHITLTGTTRADLYEADGTPIRPTLQTGASPDPPVATESALPRTLALKPTTGRIYLVLHSARNVVEEMQVTLSVPVPVGIAVPSAAQDPLPRHIHTLTGLRIDTRSLPRLPRGVYIVNGRKRSL